jgi:hypothetical protein
MPEVSLLTICGGRALTAIAEIRAVGLVDGSSRPQQNLGEREEAKTPCSVWLMPERRSLHLFGLSTEAHPFRY